jgi:hypothetical protein
MTFEPNRQPKAAHIWTKHPGGFYTEPSWCSERLFDAEPFVRTVMDPAAGSGRIPIAAAAYGYEVVTSDIVDRGFLLDAIGDFLTSTHHVANIVSNPPFPILREFTLHALTVARRKVALLWPLRRLPAARWLEATPLRRIHLLTPRPSLPPGDLIAAGMKPGNGSQDFCWLVFERGYIGNPETLWLHRDGGACHAQG